MANDKQTKLQQYAEIQAMVQKEIKTMFPTLYSQEATKYGVASVPLHEHNGFDSNKISQANVTPALRASGNITMRTTETRYTLGLPFNPTMLTFYGNVVHYDTPFDPTTINIRAFVYGSACLGPSYYFQPQSGTSVKTGGPIQNVIQSNASLLTSESALTNFTAVASEGHLVRVTNALGTIVASATIPNISYLEPWSELTDKGYGPGYIFVDVTLDDGWEINGNFVVT